VAVASLWVILAGEPGSGWFHNHVLAWTSDIHISGLVTDLLYYIPVLAFGTGLVFGYSFDTTGPAVRGRDVAAAPPTARRRGPFRRGRDKELVAADSRAADEPLTAERETVVTSPDGSPEREPVATRTRSEDDV
jgi:hypothetical protein